MDAETERAIDLCVLVLLEAAPALALDPKLEVLGWDKLATGPDANELRTSVIEFTCSTPIRQWAQLMAELDLDDHADDRDNYWSETLILSEVVTQSIEVFDRRASWAAALECERCVGHYRDQIWDRSTRRSLSSALSEGLRLADLVRESLDNGQAWAHTCKTQHDRTSRPWPPKVPPIPPPRRM